MTLRQHIKTWLYGSCPGFAGRFPYFGVTVHFPRNSVIFRSACAQGVFERENTWLIGKLMRPGAWFFDVGANIGLMSLPVLTGVRESRAVGFEPSLSVLPYLRRTMAGSGLAARWHLVDKAIAATPGRVEFSLAREADSAYEGLRPTGRVPVLRKVEVEATTLDAEWERLGRPDVAVVKIDIEGGEYDALRGAVEMLRAKRPAVVVEWYADHLKPFGVSADALFEFASGNNYNIYSVPRLVRIDSEQELFIHMAFTETFLLFPGVGAPLTFWRDSSF